MAAQASVGALGVPSAHRLASERNSPSTSIIGAMSATPAISRHECIESIGLPTSTVGIPTRAALIGPIVDPHATSPRDTKYCGVTPALAHRSANIPAVCASLP